MTSVDACGVTLVFKHNYLPLLTGVLNLQIGFASPKMTVNLYIYILYIKNFMAASIYEWPQIRYSSCMLKITTWIIEYVIVVDLFLFIKTLKHCN